MDADANHTRPRPQPRARGRAGYAEGPGDSEFADPGSRNWPVAVAVAVIGLVLGLVAGLVYSSTQAKTYEATTSISVLPDPNLDFSDSGNNNNTANQDATAFIQSQLVVVNGAELADRVQAELKLSSQPSVEATQVGQTYVVTIVATAPSAAEAIAVAQRTAAGYDSVRTAQLTGDIDSQLAATTRQLSTVSSSLATSRRGSDATDPLTPSQTALQTEYERLLSQRSSLTSVRTQAARIVTVVAPARTTSAGLSPAVRNSLIGALLGLLVALAVYVVFRRSVRRIRTVADLSALGLVTILPVQSRRSRRGRTKRPNPAARLLATRLDPELTAGEPLVFVGVTPAAGADQVAADVATALTDRGPVLFLRRPSGDAASNSWLPLLGDDTATSAAEFFELLEPSDVPGVWLPSASSADRFRTTRVSRTAHLASLFRHAARHGFVVVIEADPISESDMSVDCGRAGASIVLVVARGSSTPSDVVVATELFEAQSVTFLGAVLNESSRRPGRAGKRSTSFVARTRDEAGAGANRGRSTAVASATPEAAGTTETLEASETPEASESPAPAEFLPAASSAVVDAPTVDSSDQSGFDADRSDRNESDYSRSDDTDTDWFRNDDRFGNDDRLGDNDGFAPLDDERTDHSDAGPAEREESARRSW